MACRGQHRRGDGGQRDDGQDRGLAHRVARTTLTAARDEIRRLEYAYSNGAVLYLNGRPVDFAMNPACFRWLGAMARAGDAVYLPLRRGLGTSWSSRSSSSPVGGRLGAAGAVIGNGDAARHRASLNGRAEVVTYRGAPAVKLVPLPAAEDRDW